MGRRELRLFFEAGQRKEGCSWKKDCSCSGRGEGEAGEEVVEEGGEEGGEGEWWKGEGEGEDSPAGLALEAWRVGGVGERGLGVH